MKRSHWEIVLHTIFWGITYWVLLLSFAVNNYFVEEINGVRETTNETTYLYLPVLFFLLSKVFIFYGNSFKIFPTFLKDKNWLNYLINILLLLLLANLIESGLNYFFFQTGWGVNFQLALMTLPLSILFSCIFWGLSNAYILSKNY